MPPASSSQSAQCASTAPAAVMKSLAGRLYPAPQQGDKRPTGFYMLPGKTCR
jgi:hypothetical protein